MTIGCLWRRKNLKFPPARWPVGHLKLGGQKWAFWAICNFVYKKCPFLGLKYLKNIFFTISSHWNHSQTHFWKEISNFPKRSFLRLFRLDFRNWPIRPEISHKTPKNFPNIIFMHKIIILDYLQSFGKKSAPQMFKI